MSSSLVSRLGSSSSLPSFLLLWIALTKREMNHDKEYWYIGSMLAKSATQKYSMALYSPQDLYPVRVSSIIFWVSSPIACFSSISLDTTLASDRIWMAVVSSRMFPSEEDSTCRILFSISVSFLLFSADSNTSCWCCSSRSGLSSATTTPSSWSASP